MRLIDADAILKADENSDKALVLGNGKALEIAYALLKKKVADAPTVDAVVVTRCEACKHFKSYGTTSLRIDGKNIKAGWCHRRARYDEEYRMPPDGFCSYGERKDGGNG